MKELEDTVRPCTRKVRIERMGLKKEDQKGNNLYDCFECSGTPGSCPNYIDHHALLENYGGTR